MQDAPIESNALRGMFQGNKRAAIALSKDAFNDFIALDYDKEKEARQQT